MSSEHKLMYCITLNKKSMEIPLEEQPEYFQKWFQENNHTQRRTYEYWGMTDKDPILMQWWGDFRRKQYPDYWIDKMIEAIAKLGMIKPKDLKVVIPDVRFKSEAQFIKDLGGEVWDVRRYDICNECNSEGNYLYNNIYGEPQMELCPFCNGNKKNYYISPDRDSNHISETDLDDWERFDEILEAESGKVDDLYKQVDKIIGEK